MSWPVTGTLMVEPTESESKEELDRFCDAMISIRAEIQEVADGRQTLENNILVNAPHTNEALLAKDWDKPYSRERAAYPAPWLREGAGKFWPTTGRFDNVYGDRHLVDAGRGGGGPHRQGSVSLLKRECEDPCPRKPSRRPPQPDGGGNGGSRRWWRGPALACGVSRRPRPPPPCPPRLGSEAAHACALSPADGQFCIQTGSAAVPCPRLMGNFASKLA